MNLLASFYLVSANAWSTFSLTTGLPVCWLLRAHSGVKEQVYNFWKLFLFMCKGFRLDYLDFFRAYAPPARRGMPQKAERGFRRDCECH